MAETEPEVEKTDLEKYGFEPVICEETAREDFERMCKARDIELGEGHQFLSKMGVMSREIIVSAIMRGTVTVGDECEVVFKPRFSDRAFAKETAPTLVFGEVDGGALLDADGLQGMSRDFKVAASITKQPLATLKKLRPRDCTVLVALMTVFLD
jgi:hypothetical protein